MFILDTLEIAWSSVKELKSNIPQNYKLTTLYNYVTNLEPSDNAHRAEADVTMLLSVLLYDKFWFHRSNYIHKIDNQTGKVCLAGIGRVSVPRLPPPNDDSDTDASDSEEDSVTEEEVAPTQEATTQEEESKQEVEEVFGWKRNSTFEGVDSTKLFNKEFQRRTTRNVDGTTRIGVQCSTNSVNSPIKAWTQIFTVSILNRIVQYTNN
jgi:hypothetical protein